ncbi:uncharacterized protein LOC101858465 isoform X3 [Aplysia californica]|nr:uncharacterized protein LOC101858465 isoform X3 [Aplysia californica]
MSGEEQPQPFASDEEMNSESSRAPDGARHILPIIIEEPEPISSDEEMNSESSRAPDGARHILPIIIEEPEPISSDEEMSFLDVTLSLASKGTTKYSNMGNETS